MLPASSDSITSRRTRRNVKQSKFGCFTCKYVFNCCLFVANGNPHPWPTRTDVSFRRRRVKCDELKPACQRCLTAKQPCLGYPRGAPPGPWLETCPSAAPASALSSPQDRAVALACRVLLQGPRRAKSDLEVSFWKYLVPQLAQSVPSVQAAAAAFGAAYEKYILGSGRASSCPDLEPVQRYSRALRLVQLDLSDPQHGTVPCIVACLLLAFTEVLQHRSDKAHLHLRGVFALMAARADRNPTALVGEEDISLLFQKLDLQSATYALGRPPDLPPSPPVAPDAFLSVPRDRALFRILHSCYHFTSTAHPYRYMNRRTIPPELFIEQGRHLGMLQYWLSCHRVVDRDEQLLVLRAQCLAAFIYVATILQPHQTAFDNYGQEFQEIITSAEALLGRTHTCCSSLPSFTPEMGIIQPLFFASLKYRHPFWRRKALGLLMRSGREGPWCGEIEATVAWAVVKAEECPTDRAPPPPGLGPFSMEATEHPVVQHGPGVIAEERRVHACWVVAYAGGPGDDGRSGCGSGSGPTSAEVRLSRCRDLDRMLGVSGRDPCAYPWQDKTHWDCWIENVQICN